MFKSQLLLSLLLLPVASSMAMAQVPPGLAKPAIQLTGPFEYETGETFIHEGQRLRLYGVQSCIRGTEFIEQNGSRTDCGSISIAMLATYLIKLRAGCQPVGEQIDDTQYVVCAGISNGATIDIGEALIVSGYAFAAAKPNGDPVFAPYLVAEITASEGKVGLWEGTFPHPVTHLLNGNKPKELSP